MPFCANTLPCLIYILQDKVQTCMPFSKRHRTHETQMRHLLAVTLHVIQLLPACLSSPWWVLLCWENALTMTLQGVVKIARLFQEGHKERCTASR
jgi:hypothetical protein